MQEFVGADGEFAVDHIDQTAWQWLTERMSYLQGDLSNPQTYRSLDAHLAGLDKAAGTAGNRLFYLAIADRFFSVAVDGLGAAGLLSSKKKPGGGGGGGKTPSPQLGFVEKVNISKF